MAYPLRSYLNDQAWGDWAKELVELTNNKAQLLLAGHSHVAKITEPEAGGDNGMATYPVLRGSIRSNKYTDREGISPLEFTGTAVEIVGNTATIQLTTANKKVHSTYTLTANS
jgi:hypothetical protein